MLGAIVILLFAFFLTFFLPFLLNRPKKVEEHNPKYNTQMKKLWTIAQTSMRERKPLRAEKALLTILKFDEKNAAAYNRLGIIYAKEQKFDDAIECFEIAQSLDHNPSSLHNVGLIYLETGAYEKAEIAFQQALKIEGDIPARYLALAKTQEKLGKPKDALLSLESAYELNPDITTLRQILALNESMNDTDAISATTARIKTQLEKETKKTLKKRTLFQKTHLNQPTKKKIVKKTTSKSKSTPQSKPVAQPKPHARIVSNRTRTTSFSTQPTFRKSPLKSTHSILSNNKKSKKI